MGKLAKKLRNGGDKIPRRSGMNPSAIQSDFAAKRYNPLTRGDGFFSDFPNQVATPSRPTFYNSAEADVLGKVADHMEQEILPATQKSYQAIGRIHNVANQVDRLHAGEATKWSEENVKTFKQVTAANVAMNEQVIDLAESSRSLHQSHQDTVGALSMFNRISKRLGSL